METVDFGSDLSKPCVIYALVDPGTDDIRYVGKTVNLNHRFIVHRTCDGGNTHKDRWWAQLEAEGLEPHMWVLERATEEDWQEAEIYWIEALRADGEPLVNIAEGGQAGPSRAGQKLTEEHKRKIGEGNRGKGGRASFLGRHHTAEAKAKISQANMGNTSSKGRVVTAEHRQKLSEANKGQVPWIKGKHLSVEARAKISKSRRGMVFTREHRRNLSEAHKGKKLSEETKRKIGEAGKGRIPWNKEKRLSEADG